MAVMGLLMPVAGLIKVRTRATKADIDSPFFKMHYRTTTTILFIGCLIVTCNDLIGSTISCINDAIPGNVLNTYCWIMSTFSVPSSKDGVKGLNYAYPGVGPETDDEGDYVFHAYYQWVPFMLFLQGVMFYIPHYLWKTFEDKKLDKITAGLRDKTINVGEDKLKDNCQKLVKYLWATKGHHTMYAAKYFFCDVLNFANVIGQMYFINTFLGGVFMTYGTEVLNFINMEDTDRSDPMMIVFPRVTKCTFHKYGPSGTIQKHDAMCVLALNIINEKIYITLWFWFIILAILTAVYMLYVLSMVTIPSLRKYLVVRKAKNEKKDLTYHIIDKADIGDWFLIFLLSRNMDTLMYNAFIEELSEQYKSKSP
jgi:hypothetical protein